MNIKFLIKNIFLLYISINIIIFNNNKINTINKIHSPETQAPETQVKLYNQFLSLLNKYYLNKYKTNNINIKRDAESIVDLYYALNDKNKDEAISAIQALSESIINENEENKEYLEGTIKLSYLYDAFASYFKKKIQQERNIVKNQYFQFLDQEKELTKLIEEDIKLTKEIVGNTIYYFDANNFNTQQEKKEYILNKLEEIVKEKIKNKK